MSARRWLLAVAVVALLLAGAGLRMLVAAPPPATVVVWFPDHEGRYLAPLARSVKVAAPASAIAELLAGPAPGSPLGPALSPGSQVHLLEQGDELTAHLTPLPGALGQEAVAKTLLGVPGVRAVTVGGRRWSAAELSPAPDQALIFYPYRGIPVPVMRRLPAAVGTEPLQAGPGAMQAALNAFLTEPPPPGLTGPPGGISVEGLIVKGDVVYVRLGFSPGLTQAVLSGAWNFSPYYLSVVHTLTEFPGVRRVQFDFPGLTVAALRQCRTPLSVPLPRPYPEKGRA